MKRHRDLIESDDLNCQESEPSTAARPTALPLSKPTASDGNTNDRIQSTSVLINTRMAMIMQNNHSIQSLNEEIEAHVTHALELGAWRFPNAGTVAMQAKDMVEGLVCNRDWFQERNAKLWQGVQQDCLLLLQLKATQKRKSEAQQMTGNDNAASGVGSAQEPAADATGTHD